MRILLLKENLKSKLETIERVIPRSYTLPSHGGVLLEAQKNILKVSATDLEMAVEFWVFGKTEKEGAVAAPARLVSGLIHSIKAKQIILEKKEANLIIKGGDENFNIKTQTVEDFPLIPNIIEKESFCINAGLFCQALSRVIDNISFSNNRPEICGVYFKITPSGITIVSTDSFRLAEKSISLSQDDTRSSKEYSFIVPPKILHEVIAVFSEKKGQIRVCLSQNQVVFEYTNPETSYLEARFLSRLIEGNFPNYEGIIPQKTDSEIVVSKNELLQCIKTASIITPKTNEVSLGFRPDKNTLEIRSQDLDKGEYYSLVRGSCAGEDVSIDFNWRFLLSGLTNIKSQEVLFGVQKNDGPAILRPIGDSSYTYVVMPIRSL